MIEVKIKGRDPRLLAELIASSTDDQPSASPEVAGPGSLVRAHHELADRRRPSRHEVETVNFAKLDAEDDWSDV
jgi:hypothetical protein